jgi:soluble lytic murein transglycosylase
MKRLLFVSLIALVILIVVIGGYFFFNQYWIHRYDPLIARHAAIYQLDPDLVWSVIYEETKFSPWKTGKDGEIGLMQVTPTVGREWASQTGMHELERQMASDPRGFLRDPERNIQIEVVPAVSRPARWRNTHARCVQCRPQPGYRMEPHSCRRSGTLW